MTFMKKILLIIAIAISTNIYAQKGSSQFRKDLKRYRNDNTKLEKLYDIVGYLERCEDVPKEFKPHMLSGDYAGHMECHVENDFLLIWIDDEVVKLVRLGSHSELFGKKKK
jgi:mRNA interferase YafQ